MSISTLPELPETDYTLYGTCPIHVVLVSIKESRDHPGYYEVDITAGDEMNKFTRPVLGSDIGRALINKFIDTHAPGVQLAWKSSYEPHRAPQPKPEYIYFITDEDGYIKIGFAANPESRLKALQTSSRQELRILGVTPGSLADEKALHAQFAEDHVRGEWFQPSQALRDCIAEVSA